VEALGKKVFYDRGLIVISDREDVFDVSKDKGLIDEVISRVNNLPRVGRLKNLKRCLKTVDVLTEEAEVFIWLMNWPLRPILP